MSYKPKFNVAAFAFGRSTGTRLQRFQNGLPSGPAGLSWFGKLIRTDAWRSCVVSTLHSFALELLFALIVVAVLSNPGSLSTRCATKLTAERSCLIR